MKKIVGIILLSLLGSSAKAQCNTDVMEAFGGTVSIALYNTYLCVGAIADGYVNESYDDARVKELMNEQVTMLGVLTTEMKKALTVDKSGLSEDDRSLISDVIICLDYLKNEAQGLHDYANDGSETSQEKYNSNRDLAWGKIEDLLGLSDEE
jgi:hypothetical protein